MPEPRPIDHDVARAGLEAAAAVVERMLELGRAGASGLRIPVPPNQQPPQPAAAPDGSTSSAADPADLTRMSRQLRADAERLVELYATWTRTLVDGAAQLAEQALERAPRSRASDGALRIGPAARGTTTSAEAWLHVLDGPPGPPARMRASDLLAHHGDVIPGGHVSTTPAVLDTTAARTSTGVTVAVAIPDGVRPGTYHGHLLAEGLPEVVLPVVVEVVS
jgi:hypothetical protein